ncbi:MAG: hypothetical protein EB084_24035 [Proteobacteria bacterium]|nr:hypothetical protein [Pseudomonadota bacterium]
MVTDPTWAAHHPITAAVNAHVRVNHMSTRYLMPEVSAVVNPPETAEAPAPETLVAFADGTTLTGAEALASFSGTTLTRDAALTSAQSFTAPATPQQTTVDVAQAYSAPAVSSLSERLLSGTLFDGATAPVTFDAAAFTPQPTAPPDQVAQGPRPTQLALEVGSTFTLAGTAFHTLTALQAAHSATALAASAHATAALAQGAAASGNLAKAMALGAQAKAQGAQALSLAESAKAAAGTAAVLSVVSGGIAVVDGVTDIHQGVVTKNQVVELDHVAADALAANADASGQVSEEVKADYDAVHGRLGQMTRQASRDQVAGGLKTVFGGMLIASPATGPAAPIVGAIGAVGYLGTTILHAIFH